jgi:hypothetical protein
MLQTDLVLMSAAGHIKHPLESWEQLSCAHGHIINKVSFPPLIPYYPGALCYPSRASWMMTSGSTHPKGWDKLQFVPPSSSFLGLLVGSVMDVAWIPAGHGIQSTHSIFWKSNSDLSGRFLLFWVLLQTLTQGRTYQLAADRWCRGWIMGLSGRRWVNKLSSLDMDIQLLAFGDTLKSLWPDLKYEDGRQVSLQV